MSQQLISHSPDLKRLRDEGYELEIRGPYLLVHEVPYVNSRKEIRRGVIVSDLTLAGNRTVKPANHVVHFVGDQPCDKEGKEIDAIKHSNGNKKLTEGLEVNRSFSNKPKGGYRDYYEKIINYSDIISHPAQAIDDAVSPKTFKVVESKDCQSAHNYLDTSSSRSDINRLAEKFKTLSIGIIGLGGTGSYILDLVAKTHVKEIHLFDGDHFYQHNAFRSPGAPTADELNESLFKADHFRKIYSKMHKHIHAHSFYIDASNVHNLPKMDHVFLCLDNGDVKRSIVEMLEKSEATFIDVGIGVHLVDDALLGMVRVTTSTGKQREHIKEKKRISFDGPADDEYSTNIQIADLNMLNAALAVIKWKKLCGFYQDLENEHHSVYAINANQLTSDDQRS